MDTSADFTIAQAEDSDAGQGAHLIRLTGEWTAIHLGNAAERLSAALADQPAAQVDATAAGRVDTAGALGLINATGKGGGDRIRARPETVRLLQRVRDALEIETPPQPRTLSFNAMMERLGRGLVGVIGEFWGTMAFNGHLLVVIGKGILNPRAIRWAPVFNLTERAGLDAIPIVVVTNFFIGAVIAFLAATMLSDFGVQIFAVETVGIGVLREFAVVITGVLLAGRSASSFAAELGAMKMQQEIDAMQVMGVDPFQALVLPRFLALLSIIPLTFIAAAAGLLGGGLVLWWTIDVSPTFFLQRIQENVGLKHFLIGLSKAPVLAVAIAAIGCRQGMLTGGDVESLGRRVTSAVVHAIFSIIMIDAAFAIMFMELNL